MHEIKIKHLSVNEAWKGRRFKTTAYHQYDMYLSYLLPFILLPEGKLKLSVVFGVSSAGSDIDNPLKPFLDILSKKYKFNDNRIYELNIKKEVVKKREEFIKFKIESYDY